MERMVIGLRTVSFNNKRRKLSKGKSISYDEFSLGA
jgi:hypothetical protein